MLNKMARKGEQNVSVHQCKSSMLREILSNQTLLPNYAGKQGKDLRWSYRTILLLSPFTGHLWVATLLFLLSLPCQHSLQALFWDHFRYSVSGFIILIQSVYQNMHSLYKNMCCSSNLAETGKCKIKRVHLTCMEEVWEPFLNIKF